MKTHKLKITPESIELQIYSWSMAKLKTMEKALIDYKMNDCWNKYDPRFPEHLSEIIKIERMRWNQRLAKIKYWNDSIFDIYIPDDFANCPYVP